MVMVFNPNKPSQEVLEVRGNDTIILRAGNWRQRFSAVSGNQYLEVLGSDGLWYVVNSTLYATELANIANGTNVLSTEQ